MSDAHIDKSIYKHKLYSEDNPTGWDITFLIYDEAQLNEKETELISLYHKNGFQLLNKTSGGQGEGKYGIAENKPSRGYHDGLRQGYLNAQRYRKVV